MDHLFEFLLRQGDNTLVLGHRTSEWCGVGPALEEDIALANTALDLIGQTQLWLGYAAEVEAKGRTANDLAFQRDGYDFRNILMLEVPNEDFGRTLMRQFFFDAFQALWLTGGVLVLALLIGAYIAFQYRDAIAAKVQNRMPKLAAKLRSF